MYYEYWGLKKPPFDNVPDPSMYVESHASVENTITETLFAIEEGNECIAVIIGDVGLGKTLCLRLILDNLSQDKYKVAFITNPDMSFVQLMREIVGQLTGQPCEIHKRIDLLETFNKIIFQTADEGKKVLLFIDEGNALPPGNLESLRLLTNMQEDHRNLFTIVMAGQIELARRLEHPHRANLFPGRPSGYPPGPPQIRTGPIKTSGSSVTRALALWRTTLLPCKHLIWHDISGAWVTETRAGAVQILPI
jgi:type II secretory pathway predicted ATPase ExeA